MYLMSKTSVRTETEQSRRERKDLENVSVSKYHRLHHLEGDSADTEEYYHSIFGPLNMGASAGGKRVVANKMQEE